MYDRHPYIEVAGGHACSCGWEAIANAIRESPGSRGDILCVESYPGVFVKDVCDRLRDLLKPSLVISTEDLLLRSEELEQRVASILTDDPVFGVMNGVEIEDVLIPLSCVSYGQD